MIYGCCTVLCITIRAISGSLWRRLVLSSAIWCRSLPPGIVWHWLLMLSGDLVLHGATQYCLVVLSAVSSVVSCWRALSNALRRCLELYAAGVAYCFVVPHGAVQRNCLVRMGAQGVAPERRTRALAGALSGTA